MECIAIAKDSSKCKARATHPQQNTQPNVMPKIGRSHTMVEELQVKCLGTSYFINDRNAL